MGAEGIAFALGECDAVAIITTKNLLETLASIIKSCSSIKTIIYFPELHHYSDADKNATVFESESITNTGCKLVSFETLLNMGLESCKLIIFLHYLKQNNYYIS